MQLWGWVFMIGSVTFVTVLAAWCFNRVLRGPLPPADDGGTDEPSAGTSGGYAVRGVRWESSRQPTIDRPRPGDSEER